MDDSDDTSVIQLDITTSPWKIRLKDGTQIFFNGSLGTVGIFASKIMDTNGNFISFDGQTITDTLGRTVTTGATWPTSTITYKDSDGITRTITYNYTQTTLTPSFQEPPGAYVVCSNPCQPYLLTSITLPNNSQYKFEYNNFGELTKITYPTGGYTRYDYGRFLHMEGSLLAGVTTSDFREVTAKHVCRKFEGNCSAQEEDTTTYAPTVDGGMLNNQFSDMRDPLLNRTRLEFNPSGNPKKFTPREINRWHYSGESTLLRTVHTDYDQLDTFGVTTNKSHPIRGTTTLSDTNQVSKVEDDYATYGNISEHRDFDYGSGASGPLVRKTVNTWWTATAQHILNRKASEVIYDGGGALKGQTALELDFYTEAIASTGAVQHDSAYGTGFTARGNTTAIKRWRNTDGTWLTIQNQYDDAGNIRKTTDPLGHVTTFSYADNFYSYTPPQATAAFVTQITYPVTGGVNHVERKQYFFHSGRASATCGQNFPSGASCARGLAAPQPDYAYFTYDSMNRLVQTDIGSGGRTTLAYNNEGALPLTTALSATTTTKIDGSQNLVTSAVVDGLGRVTQSQANSNPACTGTPVKVDVTYDVLDRKATVSNPYCTTGDPTYGITSYGYDALGRVTTVTSPSGGNVTSSYSGSATTVTDQQGKVRKSVADGLGRLTSVWEPDASNSLVNQTAYGYDTLDNLTSVLQSGSRQRTFTYNSLSQLTQAVNPESGTISYAYDSDGNLLTKIAPAPNQTGTATVTTTFTYDVLHRLTQKSYNDGSTAAVNYGYDGIAPAGCSPTLTAANPVGRRTGMCDAAGAEAWSYDAMGRVATDRRTTNSVTKDFTYGYNLLGGVLTVGYPTARTITYAYNTAAQPTSAVDSGNAINYALNAAYTPHGALASVLHGQTGTFGGITLTQTFTNRLQPNTIQASSSNGTVLDLTYCFNASVTDFAQNCSVAPVLNNGNVVRITNNRNTDRSQRFTYDELSRVSTAKTQATTGTYAWGLQFGYDIWANLLSATVTQGSAPMLSVGADTQNRIAGFCYDAEGNLLIPGACGPVLTYQYDAENRMTTTAGVTYTYDGDGKRVQKNNGKLYWYGMGSDPLVESDLSGNTTDEYIFFGGKRIARRKSPSGEINYYFADHLGTSRVVTSATGGMLDDSDFYPFGGERIVTSSSGNNYKFTGKERDTESGLDFFGARYYSSGLGRFTTPDSPSYSGLTHPQSWNLYAYTLNNPLRYNDPTGHSVECKTNATDCLKAAQASVGNKEAASRLYVNTVITTKQHSFLGIKWTTTTTRSFIGIRGDVGSFAKLGENAGKMGALVSNSRVFGLSLSSGATPTYMGMLDKIISGGAEMPLRGGGQTYTTSMGTEPEVFVDPASSDAIDSDAKRDGIPGANLGEKTAHELLGHLWSEEIAGNKAGTAQNKKDSIRSENVVRATDPTRGQKTKHHD